MKQILLFISFFLVSATLLFSQCPPGSDIDSDGDGVEDCIDPCINVPNSLVGNLSFESDFIGWDIPLNQANFNITQQSDYVLHGTKALLVSAPNAGGTPQLDDYNINSETFTAEPNVLYTLKFSAKKTTAEEGDYIGWRFEAENGSYVSFNNIFSLTTDWTTYEVNFSNDPNISTTNQFKIVLRFGTSSVDIAVDRLEVYKTEQGFEPTYLDLDNDGNPDCENLDVTNHPDYNALAALYNSTNGTFWTNNTNWMDPSQPISTWYGIEENNGRVTKINLDQNNLIGVLPSEIGDLTFLDRLEVPNNFLSGNLPTSIGNLQNATRLDFRFNSFEGNVPNSITTIPNLFILLLNNNNLSGTLPDFSNQISNELAILFISSNRFVFADFEDQFSNYIANLGANFAYSPQQLIDVPRAIGTSIGQTVTLSPSIELAQIGTNLNIDWFTADTFQFLGTGPTIDITMNTETDYRQYFYIANSTTVTGLTLESNRITIGPDPSTHPDYNDLLALYNATNGENWTNTWDLQAPINTWFGLTFDENTNRITNIDLTNNNLTGTIPAEIGNMTTLTSLLLFQNNLTGEIPNSIWNLVNLEFLFLGAQESMGVFTPGNLTLAGGIPSSIGNLQQLTWINLTGIPLTLPLQPELFNLPNLSRLRVVNCGLTGALPSEFANIQDILADNNNFTGAIPPELLNVTNNNKLSIINNLFDFSDLEPLAMGTGYSSLSYSPQRTQDTEENIESGVGSDITLNVNDTNINRNEVITALNNQYQWFKDSVAISGANGTSYTITNAQEDDSGVYFCRITNPLLPDLVIDRAPITLLVDSALSIWDSDNMEFTLYPNPVQNWINITTGFDLENTICSIYDLNGRLVTRNRLGEGTNSINVENLENGIYVIKIINNNSSYTNRFLKQ